MSIYKKIEQEIQDYTTGEAELSEGVNFSQYKLVNRISKYQNQILPGGKIDSQKNYKYWFDITSPRVNSEIKNIDFDTREIILVSDLTTDSLAVLLSNVYLSKWLQDNHIASELNNSVENFSSWGNVVWKKTSDGYEELDLKNLFVLNQTAQTLDESDVIERHLLTQSDLRAKEGIWNNIEEVIKTCGNKTFSAVYTQKAGKETSNPYYEIYERNGEVSEKELFEARGKSGGNKDKYVLAKIIVAGVKKNSTGKQYTLFADKIDEKPYREAHRGRYEGRWLRKGLTEILFDCQTRANTIGNQLAVGLEAASKWILRSSDPLIIQNALSDMRTGDIIKAKDLSQVDVRMQAFDQLIGDWNRNLQVADQLANSYEVVLGDTMPSNTPFRLGALLNQNANKLFDFLREKLSEGLERVFQDWILPDLCKDLRAQKVIDLTGSGAHLKAYQQMIVDSWYAQNLLALPPHGPEETILFKQMALRELQIPRTLAKMEKKFWDGFKPRVKITISGENVKLLKENETLYSFIALEMDPVRRSSMIDEAMKKNGMDMSSLPRSTPEQLSGTNQLQNAARGGMQAQPMPSI